MGLCGELVLRDAVVVGVGLCFCNGLGGEERESGSTIEWHLGCHLLE